MIRAVFLLSLVFTAYSCGFLQLERPPLQFIDTLPHNQPEGRRLTEAYDSIRIYADYSYLDSIDPKQKDYIQNQIMPSAIDYYQATLKIVRLTDNLQTSASCAGYTPPDYLASPGVEADLIILVVAEDWPDVTFVAGALPCGLSLIDNRPVYGLMLFNLAYLPMEKVTDNQENLSTAVHELCHVFGFNSDFYNYFINATTGETLTGIVGQKIVNDNYVTFLDVEPLTSKLRTYFNCSTLEGAYLEDEGDSGSAGSHFERRVFMNEFMTASSITEPVISEFTLALLEGTGWYQVNYNNTEPFNWGRNEGCSFLDGPCVTTNGTPNFMEWCNDDVDKACSFTSRGIGFCATGNNADYFANGCPYYMSSPVFDCEDPTNQVSALIAGELYGPSSRCFTGTLVDSFYSSSYGAYCFPTKCTKSGDNFVLTLIIDGNNITCASEGAVSVAGYNGQLNCPDPNEFCRISNPTFCEKGCSGRGTCVDNVCQCPEGWAGADCAERFFNLTCERCQNETGKGCYGDQCLARNEILVEDPLMAEEEGNEGDESSNGELEDIGWGNGEDGEYNEEGEFGEFEEGEGDIGNTDDNPDANSGDPDGESQGDTGDDTNTDDNSNEIEEEDMPHKVIDTKNSSTLDIDDYYDRLNSAATIITATTSIAILLTLI